METYLQSHEIDGSGMWSDIKAWTHNVGASLQQLAHQSLPERHVSQDVDDSDWVSLLLDRQFPMCLTHTMPCSTEHCFLPVCQVCMWTLRRCLLPDASASWPSSCLCMLSRQPQLAVHVLDSLNTARCVPTVCDLLDQCSIFEAKSIVLPDCHAHPPPMVVLA